jgi:hypothetical protein
MEGKIRYSQMSSRCLWYLKLRLNRIGWSVNVNQPSLRLLKRLVELMYCSVAPVKVESSVQSQCSLNISNAFTSAAVIGAVEELAQSSRTISLVQETFETNFFANVNIIKAILPVMRQRRNGHIVMLTGISEVISTARRNVMLTACSWSLGNSRSGNVLFVSVGYRGILRRMSRQMCKQKLC